MIKQTANQSMTKGVMNKRLIAALFLTVISGSVMANPSASVESKADVGLMQRLIQTAVGGGHQPPP
ncbi:MAG: hypothetical protein ACI8WB_001220 [Phenylobacterium sp.]|jgi:hypothetical protein